jgi:hypothetical protein
VRLAASTWRPEAGRGTISRYEIGVPAIQPGFREQASYPVVVVELDEWRGAPASGAAFIARSDGTGTSGCTAPSMVGP